MERDDVIATLNDLIETSKDGEEGFRASAAAVKNPDIKAYCERKAEQCRIGAAQLQAIIREMGGDPEDSGSTIGSVHRFWVNIRSSIAGMDDHAILAECERGEDAAKDAYEDALRMVLPGDVRMVVERQYREVKANHDRIKELRNATA
jgi:uncharacterized protein (TIGR02284 family)